MDRRFKNLAGTLAAVALAAGLTMAGTGTARAAVVPPANTWAEIFAPEINANGITLCADNSGSNAQFQLLQLWRCHGYASNGTRSAGSSVTWASISGARSPSTGSPASARVCASGLTRAK